jgi:hypothetical protein
MNEALGKPIAYGRTAEIYEWHNGQVLKLFYDWFEIENIEHEARIAQTIYASGLFVPSVGDIIQVNKRNGLVYQRLDGDTMLQNMTRKPWNIFKHARRMA